jgi:multidrug efflux pump subunit AcrA (membrane-fusion protein)
MSIHLSTRNKIIGLTITVILLIIILWPKSASTKKAVRVERQPFSITVVANGEVQAQKYETINIPPLLNRKELRIWYLKITDLVQEGTKVKKGDYIATLDPAEVEDRLKKWYDQIDGINHNLESAVLDSTIKLSQQRDQLMNLRDNLEECKIKVEQSQYESKAVQRQTNISLEKAKLRLNAAKRNYQKAIQQHRNKLTRITKRLNDATGIKDMLEELKLQLKITSPSNGIVVYGKSHKGKKIKVNDDVGTWMPVIATIPDLNSLVSEAIVKEIDIAKIKLGQNVEITTDASPDKVFHGKIIRIANIGQPISGTGMNGFNVTIQLELGGEKVLPGMTTMNQIITESYPNELVIPREAVFIHDSTEFVYKKEGGRIKKVTIISDGENETHIRVIKGLHEGDKVLLERHKDELYSY